MQTSQGYIIRILQHFATKLWNITNFVMLFQAVMNFCLDQNLVYYASDQFVHVVILQNIHRIYTKVTKVCAVYIQFRPRTTCKGLEYVQK